MAKLTWNDPQVTSTIKRAAADGLYEAAEHVLETANRSVPIEAGASGLMGSGHASIDREALIAHVSYDTPYAVRQHEELSYRHDPGRRAKWLELTVQEEARTIQDRIAKKIREAT
jgi:hypothetical protein